MSRLSAALIPCALLLCLQSAGLCLEVYAVAPTEKIGREDPPGDTWLSDAVSIESARNEWECFQVVVRDGRAAEGLGIELSDLAGEEGAVLATSRMRLHKVEWVDINAPYEVDKPSTSPNFRPDPLPPVKPLQDRFSVVAHENLVFFVAIEVPEAARPGEYRGEVRILRGDDRVAVLPVKLIVHGFTLPRRPTLQSMIGFSAGNIYKAHGAGTPEEKEQAVRLYFDEYIRARLSPFLYAPQTIAFNPLPGGSIQWEFAKDAEGKLTGEASVDFTVFDREGETYFNQREAFSAFNFAPYLWARREQEGKKVVALRFADAKGTAVERLNPDGSVNPVFDRLVVTVFRQIAAHLDEKGWLDRAIYYVTDEPGEDDTPSIMQICRLIREADPRIRTSLTYDPASRPRLSELVDEQGKSLISVWIPYCSQYREEVAAEQRKRGADYWLYDVSSTCLISHSGEANRAMMWSIWQRDAHGYLYYLSTWWGRTATPWERPNFMLPEFTYKYRQGDGYFFYPPLRKGEPEAPILDHVVPTIRWEMLREGAEDYEYLRMLEELTRQATEHGLPVAEDGKAALAEAHRYADSVSTTTAGYGIRDLRFEATEGWSFGLEEGWLLHGGGKRVDLPISISTKLPNGTYDLVLNVYDDKDYRARQFSRFLVDGRPYASPGDDAKGPVSVQCGTVEVRDGQCGFTLSSVAEGGGVILYRVRLDPSTGRARSSLYPVRTQIAKAIDALREALGK